MSFTGIAVDKACYILKSYFRDFCDFILYFFLMGNPGSLATEGWRIWLELTAAEVWRTWFGAHNRDFGYLGRNEWFEDAKRELICLVEYTNTLLAESNAGFSVLVVVGSESDESLMVDARMGLLGQRVCFVRWPWNASLYQLRKELVSKPPFSTNRY